MKRIKRLPAVSAFLCAILFTATLLVPVCAASGAAVKQKTVRVGFFPFTAYYEVDSSGVRTGYGYALLQKMATHANFSYEYIDDIKTWAELEEMLSDGRLDLLTSVQKTPENEQRFVFSERSVGSSSTLLTVRAGDTRFVSGVYDTYQGMRVGVLRSNPHAQKWHSFSLLHGFSYTSVEYDSLGRLEEALQSGEIDAIVTSSLRPLHNEWMLEQFAPSPFYLMMRKGDDALISQVNRALEQLDAASPNWRSELFQAYYTRDNGGELQLSSEERDYLSAHAQTVFRVAVLPDNPPYAYWKDGKVSGILPDIFAEMAHRANLKYELVICSSPEDYKKHLRSGDIDLMMNSGWDASTAENMGYHLTSPYISLALAQVSRIDFSGRVRQVAVPDGDIKAEVSRSPLFQHYHFISYPSFEDAIGAALSGASDAAILYADDAQQFLLNDIRSKLKVSLLPEMKVDLSVGVASGEDYRLLSILSKSAESVRGSYAQSVILNHTATARTKLHLLDYFYLNPILAIFPLLLAGVLLLTLSILIYQRLWYRRQKQYSSKLQIAKLEADKANEAKSVFLSSMSHDLRTPLNGIVGFTNLALAEENPKIIKEHLAKIKSSGELLTDLVNDTLELSRLESGKMEWMPEAVRGEELLRNVLIAVQPMARQKGILLSGSVSDCLPENLWVDRVKIQKLLLNLLSNAVKYTPAGGTVSFSAISLDPPVHNCTRRIIVSDTGIGMSEAFLERLYEPFAQEHRPEAGAVMGTGLGLSIVKRIVDLIGGQITVESKIGEGTTFTVDLPIERIESPRSSSLGTPFSIFRGNGCFSARIII